MYFPNHPFRHLSSFDEVPRIPVNKGDSSETEGGESRYGNVRKWFRIVRGGVGFQVWKNLRCSFEVKAKA
jgi:hypothetical protein